MTHETAMVVLAMVASAIATGFLNVTAARNARCAVAPCTTADERVARMLAARRASGQISAHDYERVLAVIRT